MDSRWPVPRAPVDLVDRVMLDVARERARVRSRRAMALASLACAALIALAWGALLRAPSPREGDVTAEGRMEIEIAPGVLAVLERYAHVAWTSAGVTQDRGDVFYRLAPGAAVTVRTPVGEIGSASACSRVRVDPPSGNTDSPVVFVSVAQGAVSFRDVRLGAGHYARADATSIVTDADDESGEIAFAFAHERARRYARPELEPPPGPPPAPAASLPRPAPRPPRARPTAPGAASVVAPPPVAASAGPSASGRTFLAPPCVCSPLTSLCDCDPLSDSPGGYPATPHAGLSRYAPRRASSRASLAPGRGGRGAPASVFRSFLTTQEPIMRKLIIALVASPLLLVSLSAHAEPPAKRAEADRGYTYEFSDDPLAAGGLSPSDARIRVRPGGFRTLLTRPRTHFVVEMLRSVENI
jgi:hypothetical protein